MSNHEPLEVKTGAEGKEARKRANRKYYLKKRGLSDAQIAKLEKATKCPMCGSAEKPLQLYLGADGKQHPMCALCIYKVRQLVKVPHEVAVKLVEHAKFFREALAPDVPQVAKLKPVEKPEPEKKRPSILDTLTWRES